MAKSIWCALVFSITALLAAGSEASITITSNNMQAGAYDPLFGGDYAYFNGTAIPTNTTLDAIAGGAHSKNVIDWSTSGGQTILSTDMNHQRTGDYPSYGYTYQGSTYFTANSTTPFELAGNYQVTDAGSLESGYVWQHVYLYDQTSSNYLFYNYQHSQGTHDEQFSLGSMGGDGSNYLLGNLTGMLTSGHSYEFYAYTLLEAYPDSDSGASAVGSITLTVGESSVAPEPFSLLVWGGVGVAGALVLRRTSSSH